LIEVLKQRSVKGEFVVMIGCRSDKTSPAISNAVGNHE
jgi:hypothetical protein